MSILIPGMKLPKEDDYKYAMTLVVLHDGTVLAPLGKEIGRAIELPPHGRLIDADALWEKEKSECALKKHCPKGQSIIFDAGFLAGYRAACQIASKMPTIIPADPEGGGADG